MAGISNLMTYLLVFSGAAAAVLVVLVIYGNALDTRADEEIYLEQDRGKDDGERPARRSSARMNHLARVITVLAIVTGVSLLAPRASGSISDFSSHKLRWPVAIRRESKPALSVPKCVGRRGLLQTDAHMCG